MPKIEKEAKSKKASAGSPAAKAEAAASFKYGVNEVSATTKLKPSSIRVAFRKNGIEKAEGGVYGWNNKTDFEAVIAKVFSNKPAKAAKVAVAKVAKPAKAVKKPKVNRKDDEE